MEKEAFCEIAAKAKNLTEQPAENKPAYTPRPLWQVVGAWVLLVVFIALMVAGYVRFFGGLN